MKKIFLKSLLSIATITATALLLGSCSEKLHVDEEAEQLPPEITSFSPATGQVGTQITVEGTNLQKLTSATINGEEVEIVALLSNTEAVIEASSTGRSGKIRVFNAKGSSESADAFAYEYVAPAIDATKFNLTPGLYAKLQILGTNLNAVDKVIFTPVVSGSPQPDDAAAAPIASKKANEIIVTVPYIISDDAEVSLQYFDGTAETHTSTIPGVVIARNAPEVQNSLPATPVTVGESITLTGINLEKVDSVMITYNGEIFKTIFKEQTATTIRFAVPSANFEGGQNDGVTATLYFFDGNVEQTLPGTFSAVLLTDIIYWPEVSLYAQFAGYHSAFFSLEDGTLHNNSVWESVVDPVAGDGRHTSTISSDWTPLTCSKANTPQITAAEYNSVKPYIFISAMSNNKVSFNSPANTNGQLKNFRKDGLTSSSASIVGILNEETGNKTYNSSYYASGTPVVMYRLLQADNVTEKALIDQVKGGSITKIDATTFPLDVENKKIGAIEMTDGLYPVGSCLHATNLNVAYNMWGKGMDGNLIQGPVYNAPVLDAVLMMIYYDVNGYSEATVMQGIQKIGFINIRSLTLEDITSSSVSPTKSSVVVDILWQKDNY